jgi:hypothetical protein
MAQHQCGKPPAFRCKILIFRFRLRLSLRRIISWELIGKPKAYRTVLRLSRKSTLFVPN